MSGPGELVSVAAPAGRVVGTREGGLRRFRGIPYAEAPTGERRLAPPVPRAPFAEPFEALREGATPQRVPLFPVTTVPEPSIPGEDVLCLSIVAPAEAAGPLPVLVWIHGGGFVAGSPASPWYDGRGFARDGVIVVTISYRLGADGFALLPGVPENLGLRDQLLALEWVRRNIAAFGGDPGRVTIAGQSAGGMSVLSLLASPLARGLFHRAVSVSGTDFLLERAQLARTTGLLAARLGVPAAREALAAVPDAVLQRALVELRDEEAVSLLLGPVVDGEVLTAPVAEALAVHGRDVPLLLGATGDEFDGGSSPENGPSELGAAERAAARAAGSRVTDTLFRAAVPRVAAARGGELTWAYSFEWESPVMRGATHCIDIPFLFDVLDAPGVPEALGPEPPAALARELHADVVRFAVHGDAAWPTFAGERGGTTRRYDAVSGLETGSYDPVIAP